nr:hypothetical protein BN167_250050 [Clostridioides difficile E13]
MVGDGDCFCVQVFSSFRFLGTKNCPLLNVKSNSYGVFLYYFKMSKCIFDSIYLNRRGVFSWLS